MPPGVFPGPINTSILISMYGRMEVCRLQETAPLLDLISGAASLHGVRASDHALCLPGGSVLRMDVPGAVGGLYGLVLTLVALPLTPVA